MSRTSKIGLPRPKILISERRIRRRISVLGRRITKDFMGGELTVIYVTNGALIFSADLVRQIKLPIKIENISASSYSSNKNTGRLKIRLPAALNVKGRHVLVVDDILDSGKTLAKIAGRLKRQRPASIKICVLLEKDIGFRSGIKADYVGFKIPCFFVYGYGLDYKDYCRNIPYLAR